MQQLGLWRTVAWGMAGVAAYDGAGYLIKGNAAAQGEVLVVLRHVPMGMHTHGAIMMILAFMIVHSSEQRGRLPRRVMYAMFFYSLWVGIAVVMGMWITHTFVWSAPSKYWFIAWIALGLHATESKRDR